MKIDQVKSLKQLFEVSGEYIEKCNHLKRNLDGLGVNIVLSSKENDITYKLENCPAQYKQALSELTLECLKFGELYIVAGLLPTYTPKKEKAEANKIVDDINTDKIVYLSVLIKKGFNAFVEAIMLQYQKNKLIYNLQHLKFDGEDYYLNDNKWSFENGAFVDKNKNFNFEDCNIYRDLLGCNK